MLVKDAQSAAQKPLACLLPVSVFLLFSFLFFSGFLSLVCLTNHPWATRCHPPLSASFFLSLIFIILFFYRSELVYGLFRHICVFLSLTAAFLIVEKDHVQSCHTVHLYKERESSVSNSTPGLTLPRLLCIDTDLSVPHAVTATTIQTLRRITGHKLFRTWRPAANRKSCGNLRWINTLYTVYMLRLLNHHVLAF